MIPRFKGKEEFQLLPHMVPHIRIAPFIPVEWDKILNKKINPVLVKVSRPDLWLNGAKDIQFYDSGRQSLLACLVHLGLKPHDEVLIVKNTDGPYISGCVTQTIEKVCRWSQTYSERTRLVMVIHEFGFPCPSGKFLPYQKMGLPILEDCAYAFGSRLEGADIGKFGDFTLYSLTKYYPIPFGGFLASKKRISPNAKRFCVKSSQKKLILQTMANAQPHTRSWNKQRRENWNYFAKKISTTGSKPYFEMEPGAVPGAFIMAVPRDFSGEKIKQVLVAAGVEATQYYHQGGFYFPVHQYLTEYEKEYILQFFKVK